MTIERGTEAYGAYAQVKGGVIATMGESYAELKGNILEAVNLFFEDKGFAYTLDEIDFVFDIQSFFDFYKVINAKALAGRIGMSQSLLSQYANGLKRPSSKQAQRIVDGIKSLGREMAALDIAI